MYMGDIDPVSKDTYVISIVYFIYFLGKSLSEPVLTICNEIKEQLFIGPSEINLFTIGNTVIL